MVGPDTPEEEEPVDEFKGLAEKLARAAVTQDQADQRVADLYAHAIAKAVKNAKRPVYKHVVDRSLPPETIIRVKGDTITLSEDAAAAMDRYWRQVSNVNRRSLRRAMKRVGEPYRGS